jgi:membrane dipeptidase
MATEQLTDRSFHDGLIIVDGLEASDFKREHFLQMKAGGITCFNATLAIWENAREAMGHISEWYRLFRENADLLTMVTSSDDVVNAKHEGKVAVLLGFQNTSPLEDDLDMAEIYWRLGIRVIQLTYNAQNSVATGCWEDAGRGLSSTFGVNLVRELNQFGILIDLSHCTDQTVLDTAEISEQPIAITHGNPHSFVGDDVELPKRNRSDDAVRSVARTGGIIGLSMYPKIAPDGPQCTLARFCEMVEYTANMVGIDHVGLGSDVSEGRSREYTLWCRTGKWSRQSAIPLSHSKYPDWMQGPEDFPNITNGLLDHGFDRADVEKIMGGNFLRVLRETIDKPAMLTAAVQDTTA